MPYDRCGLYIAHQLLYDRCSLLFVFQQAEPVIACPAVPSCCNRRHRVVFSTHVPENRRLHSNNNVLRIASKRTQNRATSALMQACRHAVCSLTTPPFGNGMRVASFTRTACEIATPLIQARIPADAYTVHIGHTRIGLTRTA